jgi:metal-responsive CopG/Arc/MetJ family transcriptional regulator
MQGLISKNKCIHIILVSGKQTQVTTVVKLCKGFNEIKNTTDM